MKWWSSTSCSRRDLHRACVRSSPSSAPVVWNGKKKHPVRVDPIPCSRVVMPDYIDELLGRTSPYLNRNGKKKKMGCGKMRPQNSRQTLCDENIQLGGDLKYRLGLRRALVSYRLGRKVERKNGEGIRLGAYSGSK